MPSISFLILFGILGLRDFFFFHLSQNLFAMRWNILRQLFQNGNYICVLWSHWASSSPSEFGLRNLSLPPATRSFLGCLLWYCLKLLVAGGPGGHILDQTAACFWGSRTFGVGLSVSSCLLTFPLFSSVLPLPFCCSPPSRLPRLWHNQCGWTQLSSSGDEGKTLVGTTSTRLLFWPMCAF